MNIENLSIPQLERLIAEAQSILDKAREEKRKKDQIESRKRSKAAAERKRKLEFLGEELFDKIKIGDIVKVDGIKNPQFKYREVVEIDTKFHQFTGRQVAFKRDGSFYYGKQLTTHMANKIREIVELTV